MPAFREVAPPESAARYTRQLNVRVEADAHSALRQIQLRTGEDQSTLVGRLLREEAARLGVEPRTSNPD